VVPYWLAMALPVKLPLAGAAAVVEEEDEEEVEEEVEGLDGDAGAAGS
jgi:hypothetical protein